MKKNKAEWFKSALFTLQNHSVCTFTAGYTFPNLIAPFFPAGIADNQFYVWRKIVFYKNPQNVLFKRRISPWCCVTECFKRSWVIPTSPEAQPAAWVSSPALVLVGLMFQDLAKELCCFTHSFFSLPETEGAALGPLAGWNQSPAALLQLIFLFVEGVIDLQCLLCSSCLIFFFTSWQSPSLKSEVDGANELNGLRFLRESEAHNYAFIVLDLFTGVCNSLCPCEWGLWLLEKARTILEWYWLRQGFLAESSFSSMKGALILSLWNQSALDAFYWEKGSSQQWEEGIAPVVIQRKWEIGR